MIHRVKHRVKHLRTQPDHIRQRAVVFATGIGGGIAILLWVSLILPLQLHLLDGKKEVIPIPSSEPTIEPVAKDTPSIFNSPEPRVGGIQDEAQGQPLFDDSLESPSPTTEDTLNQLDNEETTFEANTSTEDPEILPDAKPVQTEEDSSTSSSEE